MRIGLINIATGKYIRFLPQLIQSAREHFMVGHEVVHVVLTDDPELVGPKESRYYQELDGVHHFPVEHLPWPGPTLYRYHMISQIGQWLRAYCHYLFYCDVDMCFVGPVGNEILSDRVAVIHPGFYDKPRSHFTYETRPQSLACVYPWEGRRYYAGGFQGGATNEYLELADILRSRIDEDARRGITAVWHDEAHWNKMMVALPPTLELDPGYCYPETWNLPFVRRVLALDKNHREMRS